MTNPQMGDLSSLITDLKSIQEVVAQKTSNIRSGFCSLTLQRAIEALEELNTLLQVPVTTNPTPQTAGLSSPVSPTTESLDTPAALEFGQEVPDTPSEAEQGFSKRKHKTMRNRE